jgi:hypothetical protein
VITFACINWCWSLIQSWFPFLENNIWQDFSICSCFISRFTCATSFWCYTNNYCYLWLVDEVKIIICKTIKWLWLKEVWKLEFFQVWNTIRYIHSQRNHLVQGPSALKGLGFITFETWLTYFDWGCKMIMSTSKV